MPKEGHANGARGAELAGGDVVLLAAFYMECRLATGMLQKMEVVEEWRCTARELKF